MGSWLLVELMCKLSVFCLRVPDIPPWWGTGPPFPSLGGGLHEGPLGLVPPLPGLLLAPLPAETWGHRLVPSLSQGLPPVSQGAATGVKQGFGIGLGTHVADSQDLWIDAQSVGARGRACVTLERSPCGCSQLRVHVWPVVLPGPGTAASCLPQWWHGAIALPLQAAPT